METGTGPERILLVDDEAAVLNVTKKILEKMGYQVTALSDGVRALDLFRNDPCRFDLVITDVEMPVLTGDELARRIMEIRLGMPVILYTGYSRRISAERAREMGIREYVMKPSRMDDLERIIRDVLEV
ncbi:MAG TPA: response regulator [Deltaproteobacteria bacterium]|nr:response regulator [Deltaproteobacteria bacterium]